MLYDQYDNASLNGTSSQNFEAANDAFDNELADDFVVPAGPGWGVNGIDVDGVYFNGPGPATTFNVSFYTNNAGLPGTLVAARAAQAYTGAGGDAVITINPAVSLGAGTHWVSVQANQNFTPAGQWGWIDRTVQSNEGAAWQNPNGGFGVCPTWGRRATTCNIDPPAPDQVYRLRGDVTTATATATSATTTSASATTASTAATTTGSATTATTASASATTASASAATTSGPTAGALSRAERARPEAEHGQGEDPGPALPRRHGAQGALEARWPSRRPEPTRRRGTPAQLQGQPAGGSQVGQNHIEIEERGAERRPAQCPGRPQHRELVGHVQLLGREAEEGRRPAAGAARLPSLARCLEQPAPDEHTLEIRGRHVVAQCGRVEVAQLAERERVRRERETDVRVRELRPQPFSARERDRPVVERELREPVDRVPVGVVRQCGVDAARNEPEVRSGQLPFLGMPLRIAQRLELLQMRELTDVHLRRQVPADRALESLAVLQVAAGQGPRARERILRAVPQENLELSGSDLEDDRKGRVRRGVFRYRRHRGF